MKSDSRRENPGVPLSISGLGLTLGGAGEWRLLINLAVLLATFILCADRRQMMGQLCFQSHLVSQVLGVQNIFSIE